MKLKTVLLGLTAAAVSTGVAFAQMQPIPNPPETPKASSVAKHHAKKHKATHHKKAAADKSSTAAAPAPAPAGSAPATGGAK